MIARNELSVGMIVAINPKTDRSRSLIVEGAIDNILTSGDTHPHGIMVSLVSGEIGRVKNILSNAIVNKPTEEVLPTNLNSENLDTLIAGGENHFVEFKTSMLWSLRKTKDEIEKSNSSDLKKYTQNTSRIIVGKTLAGFLNSDGGTLVIGIKEDKQGKVDDIISIESEYFKLTDPCEDGYRRAIVDSIIKPYFPSGIMNRISDYIQISFEKIEGKTLCVLKASKSDVKVFLKLSGVDYFFIRVDASTREITGEQVVDYCKKRFN